MPSRTGISRRSSCWARASRIRVGTATAPPVVDGDNLRHGLNSDLAFSAADRAENIRRAGEVAGLFCNAGMIAITAFISPYCADREKARRVVPDGQFIEVFVSCPIEVCERRDPKGNFRRARSGELADFTGISAPYEEPPAAEVVVKTDEKAVDDCVESIVVRLFDTGILGKGAM